MPLTLTPEEVNAMDSMEAPLEQALAEGVDLPGGLVGSIPELTGYSGLSEDLKTLGKGAIKTSIAAFISGIKSAQLEPQLLSLENDWNNTGDAGLNNGELTCHKNILGEVTVNGVVVAGSSPSSNISVTTLPVGYRPATDLIFTCAHANGGAASIRVYASGEIVFLGLPTADEYLSLNFRFQAA